MVKLPLKGCFTGNATATNKTPKIDDVEKKYFLSIKKNTAEKERQPTGEAIISNIKKNLMFKCSNTQS